MHAYDKIEDKHNPEIPLLPWIHPTYFNSKAQALWLYIWVSVQLAGAVELHWLNLCRKVRPSQHDIKPFDGEASALEIWWMWKTPLVSFLPGSLWPWVVVPDRVLSMDQIEQTMYANKWLMLNCDLFSNIWNYLTVCKKELRPI